MKNFFALILISTIFFLVGMTVGSFAVKPKTKDYFSGVIKTYNPAVAVLSIYNQGTLKKLSNNEIILIDNQKQESAIVFNSEMKKVITYQDYISHRPAEKTDFTTGSKVLVRISADWIYDRITIFSLGLQAGN